MGFAPHSLTPFLQQHPTSGRRWVGFSGGVDSTALLHALAQLGLQGLSAIHIHHGLQQSADQWVQHCQHWCRQWQVPLTVVQVNAAPKPGESPEAAARHARYHAFESLLQAGDQLLTAHHQQDQAETFLLRALRGSGPRGLAAMRSARPLGKGVLLRPLLACSQQALIEYALHAGLEWIEDPSNRSIDADRNFLRHQVLPLLQQRWPSTETTLSRSAAHCAEAERLLQYQGRSLLQDIQPGAPLPLIDGEERVKSKLRIRSWLDLNGVDQPDSTHLERIVREVLPARKDATPLVEWSALDGERIHLRRYRQSLYLLQQADNEPPADELSWNDLTQPLVLNRQQQLQAVQRKGQGIVLSTLQREPVSVRWRQGGERCQPAGTRQRRTLKNLLRERGIPPWERERIPLLYIGDQLAQVVGHFVCEPFQADKHEAGMVIETIMQ